MKLPRVCSLLTLVLGAVMVSPENVRAEDGPLRLNLRSRVPETGQFKAVENKASWDPQKTALIICDMWDDHWCKSAANRVAEMAGPLNSVVKAARARGIFVIHAPSTCTGFYSGTPQRKRAEQARFGSTPKPLVTAERWG